MAFDPRTAKPLSQPRRSGFDPSTARPVAASNDPEAQRDRTTDETLTGLGAAALKGAAAIPYAADMVVGHPVAAAAGTLDSALNIAVIPSAVTAFEAGKAAFDAPEGGGLAAAGKVVGDKLKQDDISSFIEKYFPAALDVGSKETRQEAEVIRGAMNQMDKDIAAGRPADREGKWNTTKGLLYDVGVNAPQLAASAAVTAATRNPSLGASVMASTMAGQTLQEGENLGLTPAHNFQRAAPLTAAEFVFQKPVEELLAMPAHLLTSNGAVGAAVKKFGTTAAGRIAMGVLGEAGEEGITQMAQDAYDAGALDQKMTFGQFLGNAIRAAAVGGIAAAPISIARAIGDAGANPDLAGLVGEHEANLKKQTGAAPTLEQVVQAIPDAALKKSSKRYAELRKHLNEDQTKRVMAEEFAPHVAKAKANAPPAAQPPAAAQTPTPAPGQPAAPPGASGAAAGPSTAAQQISDASAGFDDTQEVPAAPQQGPSPQDQQVQAASTAVKTLRAHGFLATPDEQRQFVGVFARDTKGLTGDELKRAAVQAMTNHAAAHTRQGGTDVQQAEAQATAGRSGDGGAVAAPQEGQAPPEAAAAGRDQRQAGEDGLGLGQGRDVEAPLNAPLGVIVKNEDGTMSVVPDPDSDRKMAELRAHNAKVRAEFNAKQEQPNARKVRSPEAEVPVRGDAGSRGQDAGGEDIQLAEVAGAGAGDGKPGAGEPVSAPADSGQGAEVAPSNLQSVPVADIQVSPKEYQFRSRVDEAGVDDRLKDVKKWDPLRAGIVMLHQRKDGRMFVADGHHRVELAKRAGAGSVNAMVLREADGVTVADARRLAALANLANNNGTAVDAAKVFRGEPDVDKVIEAENLPNNAVIKQGIGLAKLAPEAFDIVVSGNLPERDGAVIGERFPPEQHVAAVKVFQKIPPQNAQQAEILASEIKQAGFGEGKTEQTDMFGAAMEDSLLAERVKLIDSLAKSLKGDKAVFAGLERNAGRIEATGKNKLDRDTNKAIADDAARLADYVTRMAATDATLRRALNDGAKRLKGGESAQAVVKSLREVLQNVAIQDNRKGGEAVPADGSRPRGEAPSGARREEPAGERVQPQEAGKAAPDSKAAKENVGKPLHAIKVKRSAVESDTGKKLKIKQRADEALRDVDEQIATMRSLMQCLRS